MDAKPDVKPAEVNAPAINPDVLKADKAPSKPAPVPAPIPTATVTMHGDEGHIIRKWDGVTKHVVRDGWVQFTHDGKTVSVTGNVVVEQ